MFRIGAGNNRCACLQYDNHRYGLYITEVEESFEGGQRETKVTGVVLDTFKAFNRKVDEQMSIAIERVIFNDPATIVIWSDKTKTVVKCQPNDTYDREKGLALCISKKFLGNKGNFNEVFKTHLNA